LLYACLCLVGGTLLLETSVVGIAGTNAREVEAVPPQVAKCGSETESGTEVQDKATAEHAGDRSDSSSHCDAKV